MLVVSSSVSSSDGRNFFQALTITKLFDPIAARAARWYQKSQTGNIFEGLGREIVGIFYGH
jgi:hypothetical protein